MRQTVTSEGGSEPMSEEQSRLISDGTVIALATASGYLVAFQYESGYASYFGIPVYLITPNITTVFVAGLALVSLVVMMLVYFDGIVSLVGRRAQSLPRPIATGLLRLSPAIVPLAALMWLFGTRWQEWAPVAVAVIVFGCLEFVLPLLSQPTVSGYAAKLEAQQQADRENLGVIGSLGRRLGRAAGATVVLLALASFVAYSVGRSTAMFQRTFVVRDGSAPEVVPRIYGDLLVAVPFDAETKRLHSRLVLQRVDAGAMSMAVKRDVGPLAEAK